MIYKIKYKNITFNNLSEKDFPNLMNGDGLFTFPAAPPLATLELNSEYHKSLISSDYVFFDSGYFVLLLRYLKGIKVNKFSGYKFLKLLFKFLNLNKEKKIFLIDPFAKNSENNLKYLKNLGCTNLKNYVAPIYDEISIKDEQLLKDIIDFQPEFVIINLGGGVQEVLGNFLKKNIKFKCKIICTGGAISYFTKDQAPINDTIDTLYLGWFFRLLFNPLVFIPRLTKSFSLFFKVLKDKVEII